ncbi:uncharacterized protein PV07_07041 [Cladophialophora immunda]|uniref:Myb-like DNA-binding domain-containing protein n=1 Tax=Cladophialophora immunda TaxID=569365 RepID=A0A0D2CUH2_9EURO|nr:uncharacterized protein PV07_07041 [Cladophialophora immunda]KIW27289.1 hypothetical protein PV07_07041 [Cladophialophora immunda]OQV05855.1 hypothetical protein CLAIMM_10517 [Cladophialophora immunda]
MSPIAGNEAFLAACIKYAKEKVTVDFEALANELKMSKGGAANKFRAIMKQLEEDGAAWTTKDDKAEPQAAAATGGKRKATAKKGAPNKSLARITPKTKDEITSSETDETDNEPPKKKARGKATKTNAAKLAEGAEIDNDADVATTLAKKSKGKGVKKVNPATPDEGSLGDDEATPGDHEAAKYAVKKDVSTSKMVKAAAAISKTDTVPPQDDN